MRQTAILVYSSPLIEETAEEGRKSEYREIFRKLLPADVQHALLKRCGDHFVPTFDYHAIAGSLDYPCTLGLPEAQVRAAAAKLRSQDKLVPALQLRFADIETTLVNLQVNRALRANLQLIARGEVAGK